MFTGIVEEVGRVLDRKGARLVFAAEAALEGTRLGDSINVNGVCLTVVELGRDWFAVDAVPETLRRSNLGTLRTGDRVNLERALAAGQRMGGHFVQGHIEGTGEVLARGEEAEAWLFRISLSQDLMKYVVPKGFIAVDGTSLTVIDAGSNQFSFTVVPFTQHNTVLGARLPGDRVNIETDIIGRYVERLIQFAPSGGKS